MAHRTGRLVAAVALTMLAVLTTATPANAVSAAVSADYAYVERPPYEYDLLVTGSATCSEPTGQEVVHVHAYQYWHGISVGNNAVTVTCAAGSVYWWVYVTSALNPWSQGEPVYGTVTLSRAGVHVASSNIDLVAQ